MRKYTVLVHEAQGRGAGYWAEVEQLPGCYASSDNLGRLAQNVQAAVEQHVNKLKAEGHPLPDSYEPHDSNPRRWQIAVAD